jgi:hypothetical protein
MKKILLAVTAMLVYNNSMACTTTTVVTPDGRVTSCTVCATVVVCQ